MGCHATVDTMEPRRILNSSVPTGSVAAPVANVVRAARQSESEAMDRQLQRLWEKLVQIKAFLPDWDHVAEQQHLDEYRLLMLRPARRLSPGRISSIVNALGRWEKFAVQELRFQDDESIWHPSIFSLGHFLTSVAGRGPTAAAGVAKALTWWEEQGLPLRLDSPQLREFKLFSPGHTVRQARELPPWLWHNMHIMLEDLGGSLSTTLAAHLVCALTCIRQEHTKKSVMVSQTAQYILCRCSQGKRREGGSRPSFGFVIPKVPKHKVLDLTKAVDIWAEAWQQEAYWAEPAEALIPSLPLSRAGLFEDDVEPQQCPMPIQKCVEFLRAMSVRAGLPIQEAATVTWNSLRRLLPTAALAFGESEESRQALCDWQEIARGGGDGSQKPRARQAMSLRYSGLTSRLAQSAETKIRVLSKLLQCIDLAFERKLVTTRRGELMQPDSLSWEQISELASSLPPEPSKTGEVEDQSSNSDSTDDAPWRFGVSERSPASSDVSDPSEDEPVLAWLRQGLKIHVVREVDGEEGPLQEHDLVPWCRQQPFPQPAKESGVHLDTAPLQKHELCEKCLRAMPVKTVRAIREVAFVDTDFD